MSGGTKKGRAEAIDTCTAYMVGDKIEYLKAFIDTAKVELPSDFFPEYVVNEKYRKYIQEVQLKNMKILAELSGITPPEELIQNGYVDYIEKGWLGALSSLINVSGVKPLESIVEKGHRIYMDRKEFDKEKELIRIIG